MEARFSRRYHQYQTGMMVSSLRLVVVPINLLPRLKTSGQVNSPVMIRKSRQTPRIPGTLLVKCCEAPGNFTVVTSGPFVPVPLLAVPTPITESYSFFVHYNVITFCEELPTTCEPEKIQKSCICYVLAILL